MEFFSTDLAEDRRFSPHGRVDCHVFADRIVACKAYGPFNKELIEVLARIEESAFKEYKLKWSVWGYIVDFQGDCMLTRDALLLYQRFLNDMQQKGLTPLASAYVFSERAECSALGRTLYEDIHRFAGLRFADFTRFNDGLIWVRQQLLEHQQKNQLMIENPK